MQPEQPNPPSPSEVTMLPTESGLPAVSGAEALHAGCREIDDAISVATC